MFANNGRAQPKLVVSVGDGDRAKVKNIREVGFGNKEKETIVETSGAGAVDKKDRVQNGGNDIRKGAVSRERNTIRARGRRFWFKTRRHNHIKGGEKTWLEGRLRS